MIEFPDLSSEVLGKFDFMCEFRFKELEKARQKLKPRQFNKYLFYAAFGMPLHYFLEFSTKDRKISKKVLYEFDTVKEIPNEAHPQNTNKIIRHFADNWEIVSQEGHSLYFYGANSRGKTFTSLFIAYYLRESLLKKDEGKDFYFYYITLLDYINLFRSATYGYDEDNSVLKSLYSIVMEADLLIIDEIGGKEGNITDVSLAALENLVRVRALRNNSNIVNGNLRPAKEGDLKNLKKPDSVSTVRNKYGESVYSALTEKHRMFLFSAKKNKDLRKGQAWKF